MPKPKMVLVSKAELDALNAAANTARYWIENEIGAMEYEEAIEEAKGIVDEINKAVNPKQVKAG